MSTHRLDCAIHRTAFCNCGLPSGVSSVSPETKVSADDLLAVAAMLREQLNSAHQEKRGVMLSWEDAEGYALTIEAAAKMLADITISVDGKPFTVKRASMVPCLTAGQILAATAGFDYYLGHGERDFKRIDERALIALAPDVRLSTVPFAYATPPLPSPEPSPAPERELGQKITVEPIPSVYEYLKARKDARLAELQPRCDCGDVLTQCTSCAVGEWQAMHTDCRECCPRAAEPSSPTPKHDAYCSGCGLLWDWIERNDGEHLPGCGWVVATTSPSPTLEPAPDTTERLRIAIGVLDEWKIVAVEQQDFQQAADLRAGQFRLERILKEQPIRVSYEARIISGASTPDQDPEEAEAMLRGLRALQECEPIADRLLYAANAISALRAELSASRQTISKLRDAKRGEIPAPSTEE